MLATISLIEEEGKLPDNEWLLTVLSHIQGKECVVFQKDYKYVKPVSENQKPDIMFDNFDGLFDDLPDLDERQIRRTNQFRVPKQVKMMQQQEYLLKKQAQLQNEIDKVNKAIV